MDEIPEVDASLIDNDDIFQPKWWEIIAVVVAGTAIYVLELPTVWWVAGCLFIGCWMLQNCVRRLALRDALSCNGQVRSASAPSYGLNVLDPRRIGILPNRG
jgi:hypothetical protein